MKYNYLLSISFAGLFASMPSYAVPFNIIPQSALPTTVDRNGTVDVLYTVTNNTLATRVNNFVKWFPPNVTQLTDPVDPTICGVMFNLGPNGSINQSCTLKLRVSGVVDRTDPNPHHHLFVCFPGGKTCAGPTPENSLNVSQGPLSPGVTTISIAVGGVSVTAAGSPLVYLSSDNGNTWPTAVFPSTTGLPAGAASVLFSVACNGRLCTALGNYFTNADDIHPISYSSDDRGASWSAVNILSINGVPLLNNHNQIVAASCVGQNCTAVGFSSSSTPPFSPLTYSSLDNGVTWSEPNVLTTAGLPIPNNGARLGSVSCSGTNCSTVGFYNDVLNDRQPVSYHSTNNGVTWSPPILPPTAGLPVGYEDAKLTGVSCIGTNCSAVGEVNDPIDPSISVPFSYTSVDSGLSWSSASILTFNALPAGHKGVILNGVSCAGALCVAVGIYTSGTNQRLPVNYISSNSGVTWSDVLILPTSGIPAGFQNVSLLGVSCIGNNCSAVGSFTDINNVVFPLTYYSADNGATWITVLPTSPSVSEGALFGVGGSESGNLQT